VSTQIRSTGDNGPCSAPEQSFSSLRLLLNRPDQSRYTPLTIGAARPHLYLRRTQTRGRRGLGLPTNPFAFLRSASLNSSLDLLRSTVLLQRFSTQTAKDLMRAWFQRFVTPSTGPIFLNTFLPNAQTRQVSLRTWATYTHLSTTPVPRCYFDSRCLQRSEVTTPDPGQTSFGNGAGSESQ
jgi:hypothetical protein